MKPSNKLGINKNSISLMLAKPFGLNDIFQLTRNKKRMVPLAGIEPALLAESDFELSTARSNAL